MNILLSKGLASKGLAFTRILPRSGPFLMGFFSLGILCFSLMTLVPNVTEMSRAALGHTGIFGAVNKHLNPFRTRHALLNSGLPVYDIKIKPHEYGLILETVEKAKARGRLTDDLKQWAKAKFIHEGVVRDIKLRIRGDLSNHWSGPRKSWRIKIKGDDAFDGIREFNLILTSDGKGLSDHFCYRLFDRLGVMTLRDKYVVLRINGVLQGVYWQVEQVGAPLLAHHKKPDGSVFLNPLGGTELGSYKEQVTLNDETSLRALQVLLDFEADPTAEKFSAACSVTDMEDYLAYLAASTLLCSDHTTFRGDNHKIYYNPSRGLFYRIPWDMAPQRIPRIQRFEFEDRLATFDVFARYAMSHFRRAVILDDDLRLKRNRILWDLVKDDSLLRLFDETYAALKLPLWADVMGQGDEIDRIQRFRTILAANSAHIRNALSLNQSELRVSTESSDRMTLQLAVNQMSGVTVRELVLAGDARDAGVAYCVYHDVDADGIIGPDDVEAGRAIADSEGVVRLSLSSETIQPEIAFDENYTAYLYAPSGGYTAKPLHTVLFPKTRRRSYIVTRAHSTHDIETPWPVLTVNAENAVSGVRMTDAHLRVRSYDTQDYYDPRARDMTRSAFLSRNMAFKADPDNAHVVVITPGAHFIRGVVTVPQSVTLRIEPGAVLLMGEAASIVCFGPVHADGTADKPIKMKPAAGGTWGTFAIARPGGESIFRNVHINGGRGATVHGIVFTGCLAVHDGDVRIEHCRFTHIPAEDALNVKNGKASVRDSYFAHNASDAIDFDFVEGEIIACHFEYQLDEGIDTSGSTVAIVDSRIIGSGDKGVSCGEESRVSIVNTLFLENTVAVAVKDLSVAQIRRCIFVQNPTAVYAFRKKPIFAGGRCYLFDSIVLGGDPACYDKYSTVTFKNSIVPESYPTEGCRTADKSLIERLRRNDYVLDAGDTARTNTAQGVANAAPPVGIAHAVAKLN